MTREMITGKKKKEAVPALPSGPWDDEGFDWGVWVDQESGLQCVVRRGGAGAWCGYVIVPREHPINKRVEAFGQVQNLTSGNPVWLDVHGGVTFHGSFELEARGLTGIAVGFDCAHFGDLVPRYADQDTGEYRTAQFAIDEVHLLARQIAEYNRLEQLVSGTDLGES
jgi:hypothetical protein